ncbi:MAG: hypothetical protein DWQ09_03760 [Proteobacteria bacterium]|nr:MAG: hypothetical protein DWQ09_03760 [Pseudomonadota bacterium]QKK11119.1 MAG: hypothetical protein HND59_05400 [Pseudomonadota bacterium]
MDDPAFHPKQRVGLGPTHCHEHCIDLRIAPGDLFRSCPDPETDDTTCELDFRGIPPPRVRDVADYRLCCVGLSASLNRHGGEWARAVRAGA